MTVINEVHCADNAVFLDHLDCRAHLVYMDPPYDTNRDFGEFCDKWSRKNVEKDLRFVLKNIPGIKNLLRVIKSTSGIGRYKYIIYIASRLMNVWYILRGGGSLFVHCDGHASHHIRFLLDYMFSSDYFVNEIIWNYNSGGLTKRSFAKKHDTIYWYAKGKNYTFNEDIMREPYTTGEANTIQKRKDKDKYNDKGRVMHDVWQIPFICTTAKERSGYPTQKPVKLLRRIIEASTNKGDLVVDPFCGSGTTLVAAKELGRKFIGCDINQKAVDIARDRLSDVSRGII